MELEPRTTAPAHATGAVEFVPIADVDDDATFRLREPGDVAALAASIGRLGHLVPVELRPLPGLGPDDPPRWQVVAGFRRLAALRLLARERVIARIHEALDDDDAWAIALAQALLGEPLRAAELEALRARVAGTRAAAWAGELVEEALVRAPVDPAQREAFLAFLAGAAAPRAAAPAPADESAEAEREAEEVERPSTGSVRTELGSVRGAEVGPSTGSGRTEIAPARGAEVGASTGPGRTEPAPPPDAGPVEVTPEELALDVARRLSDVVQDLAVAFEAWGELPEEGRRMIVEQARYVAELYPHLKADGR
jgi:hypothetical protein